MRKIIKTFCLTLIKILYFLRISKEQKAYIFRRELKSVFAEFGTFYKTLSAEDHK